MQNFIQSTASSSQPYSKSDYSLLSLSFCDNSIYFSISLKIILHRHTFICWKSIAWWATVQGVQRFGHNWVTKHNSLFIYLPIYFLIIFSVYGHSQVAIFEVYKEHSCGIQVISVLISGQPPNCNSPQNNSFNSFGC